jgi:hypothetical protein
VSLVVIHPPTIVIVLTLPSAALSAATVRCKPCVHSLTVMMVAYNVHPLRNASYLHYHPLFVKRECEYIHVVIVYSGISDSQHVGFN